jgi:cobyrinic acid a,c-diamide synthase
VSFTADCWLGQRGATARGHSFHYSTIDGAPDADCAYHARSTLSGAAGPEGFLVGSVLASYIHLHFLSNPQLSVNFVGAARRSRARVQTS